MKELERQLTRVLEHVVAVTFFVILAVVVVLVGLRYIWNTSITGANELIIVLFVYTTAIGAALAAGRREHIAIDAVVEQLPAGGKRVLDVLGLVLIAGLNAVLFASSMGWMAATGDFLMPSTSLPRIVAQFAIPLGCGLTVLYCGLRIVGSLRGDADRGATSELEEVEA